MGEEAHMDFVTQAPDKSPGTIERVERANSSATTDVEDRISNESPPSERHFDHHPFSHRRTTLDMDDYFVSVISTSEYVVCG
jgi:hypothetical protein